jgi:hypothetical protein
MKVFTLFTGDSDDDVEVRLLLDEWKKRNTDIVLEARSIHADPAMIVKLGITRVPALVVDGRLLADGPLEQWVLPLLEQLSGVGSAGDSKA